MVASQSLTDGTDNEQPSEASASSLASRSRASVHDGELRDLGGGWVDGAGSLHDMPSPEFAEAGRIAAEFHTAGFRRARVEAQREELGNHVQDERPLLLCTCRVAMLNTITGEMVRPKGRRWDCPSCALDKTKTIREMCVDAASDRMMTGTFSQPHAFDADGRPVTPDRHRHCVRETHIYWHTARDGTRSQRWRMIETCSYCAAFASATIAKFRKRMRRRWPGFGYLRVWEVKPRSDAFDAHMAVSGLPLMTRRTTSGRFVKLAWLESGGGFMDVGEPKRHHSPERVGWYLGKYLTKHSSRRMAHGYRRWSRSRNFGAAVVMNPWRQAQPKRTPVPDDRTDFERLMLGHKSYPTWIWQGWHDPVTGETVKRRRDGWATTS